MKKKLPHGHDIESQLHGCAEVLRRAGSRVTQPRMALLRCLLQAKTPLSPREILQDIQKDKTLAKVDQVSIYRNLEALSELGLVHQVSPSGAWIGCSHVDCQTPSHMLLRCSRCMTTQELDIPKEILDPLVEHLARKHSFSARQDLLQMDGVCGRCR